LPDQERRPSNAIAKRRAREDFIIDEVPLMQQATRPALQTVILVA
jgi:hypothetical protein